MGGQATQAGVWAVRTFVYAFVVDRARPPTVAEAAADLGVRESEARDAYRSLHRRHELVLDRDGETIRMAHPFSGVPTPFRVHANGRLYWANCAWDALGIPAALHADAEIAARAAEDGAPIRLAVAADRVDGQGEVIHFRQPFRAWYDDVVFT
jgi:hypothetical protein